MKKDVVYYYYFADGTVICTMGMSRNELRVQEFKHGKLLRKEADS